jgi:mannan endo-1,4-beta-mannosidase
MTRLLRFLHLLPRFTRTCRRWARLLPLSGLAVAAAHPLDRPVTPDAQPPVAQLLRFLAESSGRHILAGQQETVDWYGRDNDREMDYLLRTTGKLPAVRSFDFMFYSHSEEGRSGQRVAERAVAWHARGGIVAICFHWFAGAPRSHFYTRQSDFNLNHALVPGTRDHAEFIADMDVVAEELKVLRDAGVPVIWRPFHEVSGGWFWWGARGPEPFKLAWRLMFDRFTRHHGLNNLIWCYNPTEKRGALENWYPGDDVVDMISLDLYPRLGGRPTFAAEYRRFHGFRNGRKVVALSENGPIPDPDRLFAEGAHWPFFSTWSGKFLTDGRTNPPEFLRRVYGHPRVITLDRLPGLLPPLPAAEPAPDELEITSVAWLATPAAADGM